MNRTVRRLAAGALLGIAAALAAPAPPAAAHPLGNFSVNQLAALAFHPDRVAVTATVDLAELPTLQERPAVDADGDGAASPAERTRHAATGCAGFARDFQVAVAGEGLTWRVVGQQFGYAEGAAGLATSRLDCRLVASAALDRPATVEIANRYRVDRVGWRELTGTGHGVRLVDSPLPAGSVTGGLRSYPADLLSSPVDVRSARLRVEPGPGSAPAAPAPTTPSGSPGWLAGAERTLHGLVGEHGLTPLVGGLAVLLAAVLGAAHAALPGHGKTVMAAYLAGRQGRPRDAVTVGATVTLTHTGGVLVLGLLLTGAVGLAGEAALGWLGLASGGLVAAVGIGMLAGVRRHRAHHHRHGQHDHHRHSHRFGLLGIGVAGGLVPSPSALVVLLGAIGLGRTGFGILLVLAYGLGMAATLTAAGLLLIRVRDRWWAYIRVPWSGLGRRLAAAAPAGTAGLVLLVGLGLAGRAAATLT